MYVAIRVAFRPALTHHNFVTKLSLSISLFVALFSVRVVAVPPSRIGSDYLLILAGFV